jgi:hypothetical protein
MGGWNDLYGIWHAGKLDPGDVQPRTNTLLSPDAYKALIGKQAGVPELKAASAWGGTVAAPFNLDMDEFKEIAGGAGKKIVEDTAGSEDKVKKYLALVADAFRIFQIDTIEAQALFLAHGAGETAFARLTEGQTEVFVDSPADVVVNSKDPNGPIRYATYPPDQKIDLDPSGVIVAGGTYAAAPANKAAVRPAMDPKDFDKTFIGRGPIQVTFRSGYVQTLVYMDTAHDRATGDDATKLSDTYDKVRADPINAADPTYAFVFSSAYMHMSGMVARSPQGFSTAGMSGGYADPRAGIKSGSHAAAMRILKEHLDNYKTATEN